jgi:hypothetical protein
MIWSDDEMYLALFGFVENRCVALGKRRSFARF